jgi:hypothetical protein
MFAFCAILQDAERFVCTYQWSFMQVDMHATARLPLMLSHCSIISSAKSSASTWYWGTNGDGSMSLYVHIGRSVQ